METKNDAILTYHRMTEIFKFSHAYRSHLSDPDFVVKKEEFERVSRNYFASSRSFDLALKRFCKKVTKTFDLLLVNIVLFYLLTYCTFNLKAHFR